MRYALASHDVNRAISGLKNQRRCEIGEKCAKPCDFSREMVRKNAPNLAISRAKWFSVLEECKPPNKRLLQCDLHCIKPPLRYDAFLLRFALSLCESARPLQSPKPGKPENSIFRVQKYPFLTPACPIRKFSINPGSYMDLQPQHENPVSTDQAMQISFQKKSPYGNLVQWPSNPRLFWFPCFFVRFSLLFCACLPSLPRIQSEGSAGEILSFFQSLPAFFQQEQASARNRGGPILMAVSGHLIPPSFMNSYTGGELNAPKWPLK